MLQEMLTVRISHWAVASESSCSQECQAASSRRLAGLLPVQMIIGLSDSDYAAPS
jgi:hypothetical protein